MNSAGRGILSRGCDAIFFALLLALPFAEWRAVVLPFSGKVFGINLTGFGSASPFDLLFLAWVPLFFAWAAKRKFRIFRSEDWVWIPLLVLVVLCWWYLPVKLPWLSALTANVLDFRSLLLHSIWAITVCFYIRTRPDKWNQRAMDLFYSAAFLVIVVGLVVAWSGYTFFESHYPFQTRFTLSFPFSNQNLMAPFVSLVLIGVLGSVLAQEKRRILALFAVPILALGAAFTGSRSNFVLLVFFAIAVMALDVWQSGRRQALRATLLHLMTLILSVALISSQWQWQPIRRALSLFRLISEDPRVLLTGDKKGARGQIWNLASASVAASSKNVSSGSSPTLRLSLLTVEQGRVKSSTPIPGLMPGQKYDVQLVVDPERQRASLSVVRDFDSKLVGETSLPIPRTIPKQLMFVGADSGIVRKQDLDVQLDHFRLKSNQGIQSFSFDHDAGYRWTDRNYVSGWGRDTGHFPSKDGKLHYKVYESATRGAVVTALGESNLNTNSPLELSYQLGLNGVMDRAEEAEPFFITGFWNGRIDGLQIADGILIRQAVQLTPISQFVVKKNKEKSFTYILNRSRFNPPSDEEANAILRAHFRHEGSLNIALHDLEDEKTPGNYFLHPEQSIPPVWHGTWGLVTEDKDAALSTELEADWSVNDYLAGGSSTLSVYRDWIVYAGKLPFIAFLIFILALNFRLLSRAWRGRQERFNWFVIITALQVLFLSMYLYPQPFLFEKFYWFFFGLVGINCNKQVNSV